MTHGNGATSGVPTTEPPTRRRRAAIAVGLMVVAASLALAAAPASAVASDAPRAIKAIGYSAGIRIYFAPPADDGGSPITSYKISRVPNDGGIHVPVDSTQPATGMAFDSTAVAGTEYSYTVTATNADGTSGPSSPMIATRPAAVLTDYTKFAESQTAFITRQYHDFLGRVPTAGELTAGQTFLTATPNVGGNYIQTLATDASRTSRLAVVRLYFAYFKRGPDHGGLAYWTAQIKNGKNLNDVSNSFARSHEFKTTYGSLSNVDFVTLVYQNVLDRDPEPTGFAFWTNQLDQKLVIRGRVMTQFSESSEYKTSSKGKVQAADAWDAMTSTNISVGDLALLGAHIQAGGNVGDVAQYIIAQSAYHV